MHGLTTNRHEGCVSTMLTDKRLEYSTAGAPLQGSGATKCRVQDDKHGISGLSVLTPAGALDRHRKASAMQSATSQSYPDNK